MIRCRKSNIMLSKKCC